VVESVVAGMAQARQVGWPVAKDDIQMTEQ
jgi:hypothetical protein